MLQLPPLWQKLGEWVGIAGVLFWFWWVLVEKGALASLTGEPEVVEILLGLPLILMIPAIFYAAVFILLRVLVWMLWPADVQSDSELEHVSEERDL